MEQFEVLLELYIDPGTSQVDPITLLPRSISSYFVPRCVLSYDPPLVDTTLLPGRHCVLALAFQSHFDETIHKGLVPVQTPYMTIGFSSNAASR